MEPIISGLLNGYELGRVSRRQLIQSLAVIAGAAHLAPATASTFEGVALNHIAIRVAEIQRSRDFYQKHFSLSVFHESQSDCFLRLCKNFLTLFQNPKPGLDHFCIAITGFSADAAMEELKQRGFNPSRPKGSDRVYFPDPDGLTVQVSSVDHHA